MRHGTALLGLLSPFSFLLYDARLTPQRERPPVPFAFEKLLVYQRSVTFADAICAATRGFPRGYFFLADQLNRAALSIAASLAEGNGRFTVADRRNFFGIARGSVRECVPLLEFESLGALRSMVWTGLFRRCKGITGQCRHACKNWRG